LSRHNVTPKLTKRKKKQKEINTKTEEDTLKINFHLKQITPLTDTQSDTWDAFYSKKNLLLHGVAGTGKSFISLYLALRELIEDNNYKKIVIIRSAVPTRAVGFLPGKLSEKNEVYEDPYRQIFTELFGRSDAYDYLKDKHAVEFLATSFVRGITLDDCIVIVDEFQNCTFHELDSVITRVGKNCKIIFCGDVKQTDLIKRQEKSGIHLFMSILSEMDAFTSIEFNTEDIVRSGLVKQYIIAREAYSSEIDDL
jgi:phosphate starvation-inducible PhoH-like protein